VKDLRRLSGRCPALFAHHPGRPQTIVMGHLRHRHRHRHPQGQIQLAYNFCVYRVKYRICL
jgi:hypothetical protein